MSIKEVRLGCFDFTTANSYQALSWSDVSTPETGKLARQSAVEGMVLLKNGVTLPLAPKNGTKVAMIRMWADAGNQMQRVYSRVPPYLHGPVYAAQQFEFQVAYAN